MASAADIPDMVPITVQLRRADLEAAIAASRRYGVSMDVIASRAISRYLDDIGELRRLA